MEEAQGKSKESDLYSFRYALYAKSLSSFFIKSAI